MWKQEQKKGESRLRDTHRKASGGTDPETQGGVLGTRQVTDPEPREVGHRGWLYRCGTGWHWVLGEPVLSPCVRAAA